MDKVKRTYPFSVDPKLVETTQAYTRLELAALLMDFLRYRGVSFASDKYPGDATLVLRYVKERFSEKREDVGELQTGV